MDKGDALGLTILAAAGLSAGSVWLWHHRPTIVYVPALPYVKPIYGADEALRLWER
jgi:hypothetical protein